MTVREAHMVTSSGSAFYFLIFRFHYKNGVLDEWGILHIVYLLVSSFLTYFS